MDAERKQQILDAVAGDQVLADKFIALIEEEDEGKTRCRYPMSEFYTYEEDIPPNTRTSTTDDCEACDECECDLRHCLIIENPDEEVSKQKKCENQCPFCGGEHADLEYGAFYNVCDEWYHQRVTCFRCNKCFIVVLEMVYRSTLLTEEK